MTGFLPFEWLIEFSKLPLDVISKCAIDGLPMSVWNISNVTSHPSKVIFLITRRIFY